MARKTPPWPTRWPEKTLRVGGCATVIAKSALLDRIATASLSDKLSIKHLCSLYIDTVPGWMSSALSVFFLFSVFFFLSVFFVWRDQIAISSHSLGFQLAIHSGTIATH